MAFEIEVIGDAQVTRAIRERKHEVIGVVAKPIKRAGYRAQSLIKRYPPQVSSSGYVRTGTLGRRWQVQTQESSSNIRITVYNLTDYGRYVQAAATQAYMHIGVWPTNVQIVDIIAPGTIDEVKGELIRWAR